MNFWLLFSLMAPPLAVLTAHSFYQLRMLDKEEKIRRKK